MTTGSKLDVRRFDYGGSLAPVTMLQGVTECVCIFCMIILMVALRRFEKKVEIRFDEALQTVSCLLFGERSEVGGDEKREKCCLLVVVGCCWLLLVVGCWLLLFVVGCW